MSSKHKIKGFEPKKMWMCEWFDKRPVKVRNVIYRVFLNFLHNLQGVVVHQKIWKMFL